MSNLGVWSGLSWSDFLLGGFGTTEIPLQPVGWYILLTDYGRRASAMRLLG
jgi:hypothetical protein